MPDDFFRSDLFSKRGILPEVAEARPYVRYTKADRQPVRDAYQGLNRYQRGTMTRFAGYPGVDEADQQAGIVITRHAPPGLGLEHVYAELGPGVIIRTGKPEWHRHPWLPASHPHIRRDKGNPTDHRGRRRFDMHAHVPMAKYLFPPAPNATVVFHHDHADDPALARPKALELHLQRDHGGRPVRGRHAHELRVKDRSVNYAKRLDVHPWAVPLLEDAEIVFFGIEGCLKADAMLSWILENDWKASVFSVPSVTLWDAPELASFALKYLQDKRVVIVPDADWARNPAVTTQAFLCRTALHDLGLEACVAAPPKHGVRHKIKGVDDYCGQGGSLKALHVLDREMPTLDHWAATWRHPSENRHDRRDRVARDRQVLELLALHAGFDGTLDRSIRSLARVIGENDHKRVSRAIRSLEELGAITVEGSLTTRQGNWRTDSYYDPSLDWEVRPTLTIRPDLRATKAPTITVEEWCNRNAPHEETTGDGEMTPAQLEEVKSEVRSAVTGGLIEMLVAAQQRLQTSPEREGQISQAVDDLLTDLGMT